MRIYLLSFLFLLFNIVIAAEQKYKGDCNEIYEYLEKKDYELNIDECIVNNEGKVTHL